MESALQRKRIRRKARSKWKQRLRRKGIFREGVDARWARLHYEHRRRMREETTRMLELQRKAEIRGRQIADAKLAPRRGMIRTFFHRVTARITGRR